VGNPAILVLVVITALGFDFTNGFHDTGNAMATSIATKALEPRVAVAQSGVLNLVGAFLSLAVAAAIASGLVSTKLSRPWSRRQVRTCCTGLAAASPTGPEVMASE
jgi:inorganic phosphate transporter, PiT family